MSQPKLTVLAVGRGQPTPIRELVADYQKRLKPFGGVNLVELTEARRGGSQTTDPSPAMAVEMKRLREKIPQKSQLIPLDSSGRRLSSRQLAAVLDQWRLAAADPICFLIGGPDGLHPDLIKQAPWCLSFGPMTFPHRLARVMLLEQLYRAMTIIHRIPYHR